MKKMDTSHIEGWPEEVALGIAEIIARRDKSILSESECNEYDSFTNPNRKAEFLSVRHLFYSLLDEMGIPSKEKSLLKHKDGKPYATAGKKLIHVSFSHSPSKVFCAISTVYDVGLDVELVDRVVNDKVVKRILNKEERKTLGEVDPVCLWTIKESVVKCMGTGLRTNLNDLTILKEEKNSFRVRFNNDNLFEICSFRQSDHQIALAYQSKNI
ncbi:MAG TPA: 4'-phosphopantetheinyl transferase superfamily protein [Gracilimonas sp.]|uniref:4'-phosphopantetheinyl transferase family protein n=1 Tax=Gracilimonas sp. TaxID=1974203 RepID=UPI002D861623|nr:4'-phosphopantetheinyl transferase superfamily protein [Gracilimonas sp.]